MGPTSNTEERESMNEPSEPNRAPRAPRATHDLGGLPGGPIDRHEHEPTFWDLRADAMVTLLYRKGVIADLSELRRGIEALAPDVYNTLSYYERWIGSMARVMVDRGVVTQEELDARVADIAARAEDGTRPAEDGTRPAEDGK